MEVFRLYNRKKKNTLQILNIVLKITALLSLFQIPAVTSPPGIITEGRKSHQAAELPGRPGALRTCRWKITAGKNTAAQLNRKIRVYKLCEDPATILIQLFFI